MLGTHILAEFYGCSYDQLNNKEFLEFHLIEATKKSNATLLNSTFHQFNPQGVTGLLLLAESHFSIHTYPEFGYAALDFFTCGDNCDPKKSLDYLVSILNCSDFEYKVFERGKLSKISLVEATESI